MGLEILKISGYIALSLVMLGTAISFILIMAYSIKEMIEEHNRTRKF